MGFLANFISEKRSSGGFDDAIKAFMSGSDLFAPITKSGARVNEDISISLTSIWACVNIISRIMASMPLHIYKNLKPSGKEKATDHPVFDLLYINPNPEQTSYDWRVLMYRHMLLWGAGISEIEFNRVGEPVALWPIPPWKIRAKRTNTDNTLYYEVDVKEGKKNLLPYQVLILPFFTVEAGAWLSPIGVHRETVGAALAVKEFGASVFGQGTNPSGILSGVKFKGGDNEADFRKKYKEGYEGLGNSHRLMLLEEGVTFSRVGLPPQDAQYLQTRQFDIAETARIYNMPLFMLQDHEKQTSWGSGIEEQKSGLVDFTLVPIAVQTEQEIRKKLLFNDKEYFAKFNFNSLLRGKFSERIEGYVKSVNNGLMDLDEVQELEDRNPLPNGLGKIRFVPLNLQSIEYANRDPAQNKDQGVNKNA